MSGSVPAARRWLGVGSRGLLVAGLAVLAGTAVVLAVTVAEHLRQPGSPALPASWVRSGGMSGMVMLPPLTGPRWLTSWQFDAVGTVVVFGVAALYLAGVVGVARRHRRRWPLWRTLSFLAGLGICLLAVSSAVGVYDMALFSSHMIGHLMLVMVAPPFLVAGRPLVLALHAVGNPWHTRFKWILRSPLVSLWFSAPVALSTYAIVLVGTHLTGLMDVIMQHAWAGQVEHLVYVLVGYQLFTVAFGDEPLRWSLTPLAKEFLLALAMGVDTFTGVVLLQSARPIAMQGMAGVIDPLAQTTLGGAIMWVGGDGIMIVVMLLVAVLWMRRPELHRSSSRGWLGRARIAALADHSVRPEPVPLGPGSAPATPRANRDVDEDEQARTDYNAWLQKLARDRR